MSAAADPSHPTDRAPAVEVRPDGLYVPGARLYLDAPDAPGAVFVSHAHADHCTRAGIIVCTPQTAALHRARRGPCQAITVEMGKTLQLPSPWNAEVTLLSAGHTLGSAMLVARTPDGTVAYTGDFKLRDNPFTPPVAIPRCDTLVMECTFGEPRYRWAPDAELLERLYAFVDDAFAAGATPVVLAYALGKGQEVLWHLTSRGYHVVVHGAIARMCELHVELGYPFPGPGIWTRYRRGEVGGARRRVLLTTPSTRRTAMVTGITPRRVAYLTGWACHPGARHMYRDCDLVIPFSDHADFDELVRTARESGAATIYTTHGTPRFAARLRAMGLNAEHLGIGNGE